MIQLSFFVMMQSESPFTPGPGCDGVIVRFADKRWYLQEWHSHEALEINLVVRGSGNVLLEDRKYPLLPGHLIWLWPGQRHIASHWSSDMLMWIIEWRSDYVRKLKRARGKSEPKPGDSSVYCCRRLDAAVLQRIQGMLAAGAAAQSTDTFNKGLQFALLTLWDEFTGAKPVANEEFLHPKLEGVLSRLNDPYNAMGLGQLADEVGLSSYYLSVLFQKQTGLTIPAYRNRRRLNQFFTLYQEKPEFSLLELALEAGFGSYAQFYRVFAESVGQTPKRWLKSIKE